MKRLVLLVTAAGALSGAALPLAAAHAKPPELPCIEIRDPDHAESYFLCIGQ